eukprot:382689-Amphidinium_carterae.1
MRINLATFQKRRTLKTCSEPFAKLDCKPDTNKSMPSMRRAMRSTKKSLLEHMGIIHNKFPNHGRDFISSASVSKLTFLVQTHPKSQARNKTIFFHLLLVHSFTLSCRKETPTVSQTEVSRVSNYWRQILLPHTKFLGPLARSGRVVAGCGRVVAGSCGREWPGRGR